MANTIIGTDGPDTLNGTNGDDIILGNGGDDILNGLGGNDILTGGPGTDTMTGGPGADIFQDTAAGLNGDTITDFLPGDRIQITDFVFNPATAMIDFNATTGTLSYSDGSGHSGSVHISNAVPGRFVVRAMSGTGVDIRLQQDAHNDFNGDGRSDVLWRNDAGTVGEWTAQSNGGFVGNGNVGIPVPTDWSIVGTGDFNGDGRVDVLLRHTSGVVGEWLGQSNGSFVGNANVNIPVPTDWSIAATGDFNGDGLTDVLLRHTSGVVGEWLAQPNGSFVGNSGTVNIPVPTDWSIVATGDFNGDGIDDVLLRHTSGVVGEWLGQPNGGFVGNSDNVNIPVPTSWHIVGTGDFNGDGRTDVLLRHDSGVVGEWLGQANGGFVGNSNVNIPLSTDWHIASIGDFNGDGLDDVLLRHDSGVVGEWLAQPNGGFIGNSANVNIPMPTNWHVQDPSVHDPFPFL